MTPAKSRAASLPVIRMVPPMRLTTKARSWAAEQADGDSGRSHESVFCTQDPLHVVAPHHQ